MSNLSNLKMVNNSKDITEVILLGKKKEKLLASNAVLNSARMNFENLFNGMVLGMGHDPDEEDCVIIPTEGDGIKIVFGPKGSLLGPDGKPKEIIVPAE